MNATDVAQDVLARLESAWNNADGSAFGAVYTPDASFVTVRGERLTGAAAIGEGHAGIFATIYAGSVNRMELVRADQLTDDVVLAVSLATLDCPSGPLVGVHRALATNVIARQDDTWRVVATQNTMEVDRQA